jgi:uncharacterized protein with HEPN domain
MSPIKREFILYLEDMLQSMVRIEEYLGDLDFKKFKQTYMIVDAIIRNFEIIGEASKNIPTEVQEKYPEIPWKKMYGLRNLIAHEYFGIDYEMTWEISKNNLPQNRSDLLEIIEKEKTLDGNRGYTQ